MAGYCGLPAEEMPLDAEGWYATGDLGRLDSDGYLTFLGRVRDMLKVGGENVSCPEVEDVLMAHSMVKLAAVVGVPDDRLEEVPVAFVELCAGDACTPEELIEHCARSLASFKVPRRILFTQEWPMTSSNKIRKAELRARALGEPVSIR